MKKILIFIFMLLAAIPGIAQHFTTVWTGNGLYHSNINILEAKLSGVNLEAGDEIAAFDGSLCVGVVRITGVYTTLTIAASRVDVGDDGYTEGHAIILKYWDAGNSKEVTATIKNSAGDLYSPTYVAGGSVFVRLSGKTELAITIGADNKPYDGTTQATVPSLSVVASGVVTGQNVNVAVSNAQFDTKDVGTEKTVTADVTLSGTDAGYYTVSPTVTTTADITPKVITITPGIGQHMVYGETDPALSYTFTPALISPDVISGTLGRVDNNNVGIYAFTLGSLTAGANYDLQIVASPATFEITKATLTVTADAKSKVYGADEPTLAYTASGTLYYSDAYSVITGATMSTATGAAASVGPHTITLSGGTAANYNITHIEGVLTVSKAELTVTADAKSKVYGAADPVLSYTASGIRYYGDAYSVITGVTMSTVTGVEVTAGAYPITISGGTADNYDITHVNGTLTVSKADPVITWSDASSITYGTLLSVTQLNASVDVAGTNVYTPALNTMLNVGNSQNLKVDFTPTDAVNYNTATKTVNIDVTKSDQSITWSDPSDIVYGTALSSTQLNALVTGVSGGSETGLVTYSPAAPTVLNTGASQELTVTVDATSNYNAATKTVYINVSKADPVITWSDPATITYGTLLSGTQLNASADVAGSFVYTPAAGTLLSVGDTQALQVDFTPTDGTNYNTATKTVHINVNSLAIAVTAAAKTKTYGDDDPALTYTYSPELIGSDAFTGSISRVSGEDVNSYVIEQGSLALSSNYILNYTGANLVITQASLTITADNKSKCYDGSVFSGEYTVSYSAFVNSENESVLTGTLAFTGTAIAATGVGSSYEIVPGGLTSGNYDITPENGTLSIYDLPAPTINGSAALCVGSSGVTYTTEEGHTEYTWAVSAGGAITSGTGTNEISVTWNTAGPQTVSVNYNNTEGCQAATATVKDVTVNPLPTATLTSETVTDWCAAEVANLTVTLSGTAPWSIVYQTNGDSPVTITDIASSPYTLAVTPGAGATSVYTISSVSDANVCSNTGTGSASYTVLPILVAPTASGAKTICPGADAGSLTATVATGGKTSYSYQWKKSINNGTSWTDCSGLSSTTLTYTAGTLITTTYYKLVVTDACSSVKESNTVIVTVRDAFIAPVIGSSPAVCYNTQPATLSASAATGGSNTFTYQWQKKTSGAWADINGATDRTSYLPDAITEATSFRVIGFDASCGACYSNVIIITIVPSVGTPTAIGVSGTEPSCQIVGSETATTYSSTVTDGTLAYSVTPEEAGSIGETSGIMSWADGFSGAATITATATGCNGPTSVTRVVNITPTVGATTFSAGATTVCQDAADETYTASATNGTVAYSVSPEEAGVITSGVMNWDAAFSGEAVVTATATGCNGPTSAQRIVTVTPGVGTQSAITVTGGTEPACQIVGSATTTTYSSSAANGSIEYIVSPVEAGTIDASTGVMSWTDGYFGTATITATASGCNAPEPVTREVIVTPSVGTPSFASGATTVCQDADNETYTATAANGTVTYSVSPSEAGIIGETTGIMDWDAAFSGTATIRVTPVGCNSDLATYSELSVSVKATLTNPVIGIAEFLCNGDVAASLSITTVATGGNGTIGYQWQSSADGATNWVNASGTSTGTTYSPGRLYATIYYRVVATPDGTPSCGSTNSDAVKITVYDPLDKSVISGPTAVCPNEQPALTATATTGGNNVFFYVWQQKPNVDGAWETVGDNSTSYTPATGLTVDTRFKLTAYNQGPPNCGAITSEEFLVTVNSQPADPVVSGPTEVLIGTTGSVYSVQSGMTTYSWSISPGGEIAAGGGIHDHTVTITWNDPVNQTVTVNYTNASGCSAVNQAVYAVDLATISVDLKVFLEGPFNASSMNTNLTARIPLNQPYNVVPWNYPGTESVVSIPTGVVDWVLIELRQADIASNAFSSTIFAKRAAFLKSDGTVVDLDGTSLVLFSDAQLTSGLNLYVVVRHRNHLAIMSKNAVVKDAGIYAYDFSSNVDEVYGTSRGYKLISSKVVMVSGDANSDGSVTILDYNLWAANSGRPANYFAPDNTLDGIVTILDYNKWALNSSRTIDSKLKSAILIPGFVSSVPK